MFTILSEKKTYEIVPGNPYELFLKKNNIQPDSKPYVVIDCMIVSAHGAIADAVIATVGLSDPAGGGLVSSAAKESSYGNLTLIKSGKSAYLATLPIEGGKTLAVSTTSSGKLRAALIGADGSFDHVKAVGPTMPKQLPVLVATLYLQLFAEQEGEISDLLRPEISQDDVFKIIHHFNNDNTLVEGVVAGNITGLTKQTFGSLSSGTIIFGRAPGGAVGKMAKPKTMGEAMKLPIFTKWRDELKGRRAWTVEELAMIPSFPDDYCVMEEAVMLAERYILSKKLRRPFSNMMWRGITSYGKSTGTEQMAALLGMPLVRITCHTTMETNDFLTSFVPDNGSGSEIPSEIPDLETAFNCPDIAYAMLTGEEKATATVEEVQKLLYQKLSSCSTGGNARFKIVESTFIQALMNGWIVEVQECSRIRDPGILVGLNEYDRAGARIPLCNGGFAVRHQDALVLYTDNIGYNSCRPLDPSVLRRMAIIVDSTEMSENTVLDRVRYNVPGFNETLLKKMYSIWRKIQEYCSEHGIEGGCCSVSELEMWVACVAMDEGENIVENCQSTVISKATSDPVDQAAILGAVRTIGCPESIQDILSVNTTPII